jgi:hypothetical protein
MKEAYWAISAVLLLTLEACATRPKPDYGKFFEHHPRSILVVPPMNKTTAVDAPILFNTTVTRPFAERGYYIFPVFLTRDILNDMGLSDEGLLSQLQPQRFRETFGADAVLFITVKAWTTTYVVIASSVTVEAEYRLIDTDTGLVIWETKQVAVQQSGGGNIIEMAVRAALTALMVDYRPLARQANGLVVKKRREGLPTGPYATDYQKDYANYRDESSSSPSTAPGAVPKE